MSLDRSDDEKANEGEIKTRIKGITKINIKVIQTEKNELSRVTKTEKQEDSQMDKVNI